MDQKLYFFIYNNIIDSVAATWPIQKMNIHFKVSAFVSAISLRTSDISVLKPTMSSFVANVLIVASTERSVLLSIYLNMASVVSLPNLSDSSLPAVSSKVVFSA